MSTPGHASFVHEWRAQRIRFATGQAAAAVADEVRLAGYRRLLLIAAETERALADRVSAGLPVVARTEDVVMHVPVEVAERARAMAIAHAADAVVCVGGGSSTGLAKAVAMATGTPIIAVPTTYAGSEATAVWGLTDASGKRTGTDANVLPRVVVYDAELTTSLPAEVSAASGLNALAHCVDSLWAPGANPINRALALEGARQLAAGLPGVVADPSGLQQREEVLSGAYLAALSFASAGSGLHHKICHVLGGLLDLPHAQTHAVVLPHVVRFNTPYLPASETDLRALWGGEDAASGLEALCERLGVPHALSELGMDSADIERVADAVLVAAQGVRNPAPLTKESLVGLISDAWRGGASE